MLRQRQEKARTLNGADSDVWLAATARAARGSPPTLYRRHLPPPASSSQASFRQNRAVRANYARRPGCAPARPFSRIDFGRATAVLRVSLLGARLLFNFISGFSLSSDVEASAQNHLAAPPERPLDRAVPRKPMSARKPILASPSDELRSSWLRRPCFRRPS